jgi:hypothetical protein
MASLDFVEGLPRSGGKDCIIVVVDKFSKALFRYPSNFKFLHFLSITSNFEHMHGALNIDKNN